MERLFKFAIFSLIFAPCTILFAQEKPLLTAKINLSLYNTFPKEIGHLVDFETSSIFIFYYKEVDDKYVLLEEESYFYKNKFQKYFGETSSENTYIRMLFS